MKITIEVHIKPFTVPGFVTEEEKRDGHQDERTGIPLCDLDPPVLESLCDQFKLDVFKKAGKGRPAQVAKL